MPRCTCNGAFLVGPPAGRPPPLSSFLEAAVCGPFRWGGPAWGACQAFPFPRFVQTPEKEWSAGGASGSLTLLKPATCSSVLHCHGSEAQNSNFCPAQWGGGAETQQDSAPAFRCACVSVVAKGSSEGGGLRRQEWLVWPQPCFEVSPMCTMATSALGVKVLRPSFVLTDLTGQT